MLVKKSDIVVKKFTKKEKLVQKGHKLDKKYHQKSQTSGKSSTTQKIKFSVKYFFSKWDYACSFLRIWSHLMKKSLMENLILCRV